jgi:hypothetical protein
MIGTGIWDQAFLNADPHPGIPYILPKIEKITDEKFKFFTMKDLKAPGESVTLPEGEHPALQNLKFRDYFSFGAYFGFLGYRSPSQKKKNISNLDINGFEL